MEETTSLRNSEALTPTVAVLTEVAVPPTEMPDTLDEVVATLLDTGELTDTEPTEVDAELDAEELESERTAVLSSTAEVDDAELRGEDTWAEVDDTAVSTGEAARTLLPCNEVADEELVRAALLAVSDREALDVEVLELGDAEEMESEREADVVFAEAVLGVARKFGKTVRTLPDITPAAP